MQNSTYKFDSYHVDARWKNYISLPGSTHCFFVVLAFDESLDGAPCRFLPALLRLALSSTPIADATESGAGSLHGRFRLSLLGPAAPSPLLPGSYMDSPLQCPSVILVVLTTDTLCSAANAFIIEPGGLCKSNESGDSKRTFFGGCARLRGKMGVGMEEL